MLELKQEYRDKLRHHVKNNSTEWENIRSSHFAKHLMAAVAFRESAQSIMETTESIILTPIGFYYSLYHLSVALLYIDHSVNLQSLKNMRHKPLINLMKSKMLQNSLISSSYISTLERLKTDREYANYQFGIRLKDDFYDVSPKYYQDTEVCFQNAVEFFSSVEKVINDISIFSFRVRTGIADGYGDDILETYLSKEHKRRVNEWLAKNNLQS